MLVTAAGQSWKQRQGDTILRGDDCQFYKICKKKKEKIEKQLFDLHIFVKKGLQIVVERQFFFFVLFLPRNVVRYLLQKLVSLFNFHNYDNLRHFVKKQDPRRQERDERVCRIFHPSVHLVCKSDKMIDVFKIYRTNLFLA